MDEAIKQGNGEGGSDAVADKDITGWRVAMTGAAIFCFVIYALSFSFAWNSDDTDAFYKGWSAIGSFIGGVLGPVVAFAAFYWLTESVRIQQKELADTRAELAKATEAQNMLVENGRASVRLAALTALSNVYSNRVEHSQGRLAEIDAEIESVRENLRRIRRLPSGVYHPYNDREKDLLLDRDKLTRELHVLVERSQHYANQIIGILES